MRITTPITITNRGEVTYIPWPTLDVADTNLTSGASSLGVLVGVGTCTTQLPFSSPGHSRAYLYPVNGPVGDLPENPPATSTPPAPAIKAIRRDRAEREIRF